MAVVRIVRAGDNEVAEDEEDDEEEESTSVVKYSVRSPGKYIIIKR